MELPLDGIAAIEVPARVAGVVLARKPDREGPEPRSRIPPVASHELIPRAIETLGIRGLVERRVVEMKQTHDRARPGCRIVRIHSLVPECSFESLDARCDERLVERAVQTDVSQFHELLYLRSRQRPHKASVAASRSGAQRVPIGRGSRSEGEG